MSGGSYDYAYMKVQAFADELRMRDDPRRAALRSILRYVVVAMYEVEWHDSGDSGPEAEAVAIDALLAALQANPGTARKAAAYDELGKWFDRKELEHGR